jgi:hypothetical protein
MNPIISDLISRCGADKAQSAKLQKKISALVLVIKENDVSYASVEELYEDLLQEWCDEGDDILDCLLPEADDQDYEDPAYQEQNQKILKEIALTIFQILNQK